MKGSLRSVRELGVPLGEGLAPGVPLWARLGEEGLGAWSLCV